MSWPHFLSSLHPRLHSGQAKGKGAHPHPYPTHPFLTALLDTWGLRACQQLPQAIAQQRHQLGHHPTMLVPYSFPAERLGQWKGSISRAVRLATSTELQILPEFSRHALCSAWDWLKPDLQSSGQGPANYGCPEVCVPLSVGKNLMLRAPSLQAVCAHSVGGLTPSYDKGTGQEIISGGPQVPQTQAQDLNSHSDLGSVLKLQ